MLEKAYAQDTRKKYLLICGTLLLHYYRPAQRRTMANTARPAQLG